MRFTESGPDIPDELLVARDEGNVLFFCGAGVSRADADLSDFLKLAGDVIDELGSLTGSQARRLHDAANTKLPLHTKSFVPVDRMFSSLDLEFDPEDVRAAVARALKPKPDIDLFAHRMLIDLSRGSDGRPRLVTTNFDLLFEACDPQMKSWGPSNLPVPERPTDFEGVIHVHGRVNKDYNGISDAVVLSSSDFGRAYLSDGWATHYIRRLMNRFKIVFVGYSADDPPVQYLLEALREEQSPVTNMYAFQYGDEADAQEQWIQKGVFPIAFGTDYLNLWDTLGAWADRARDVDAWYRQTMIDASVGPSDVSPVFRGRIAHIASTVAGTTKLIRANPPLPSSWLYVFDPEVRYLEPRSLDRYDPNGEMFDPFDHFGLDRDEPPLKTDLDDPFENRKVPLSSWNGFVPNKRDLVGLTEREIGSFAAQSVVVPRLWNLAVFVGVRMAEAPALWWAAGQTSVHPNLISYLERELRYRLKDNTGQFPRYWRYLLAAWKEPTREIDQEALEIGARAARDGWSTRLVREAVDLSRPMITVKRAFGAAPPTAADAEPSSFISLDVEYPHPYQAFGFDAASLPLAVSLWRALLVEAEQLEREIDAYLGFDTTRPDDGKRLRDDGFGLIGPLVRFTHLMEALEVSNPEAASKEVIAWGAQEGVVFERLRIWAAGRPGLTTVEQAEEVFIAMGDETFWSSRHERDLLFAIRDRWPGMTCDGRSAIETRLLESPIPYLAERAPEEADVRAAIERLNSLHWFTENGVAFSFDLNAEKTKLQGIAPTWREEFADYTAQPMVGDVVSVTTDEDPTNILTVPFNRLLPLQVPERRGRDFTEFDPFAGYSAVRPANALLALHSAMRRAVDDTWRYWSTFLRSTSKLTTSARLDSVVVALIRSLPSDEIAKIWYPLIEWLTSRAQLLESRGLGQFDMIWDKVVAAAELHPSGYKQKPKRDWPSEALNSPIGRLVLALMQIPLPEDQKGVPPTWVARMTKVLKLEGDHGRHALHLAAQRALWLHHYEPVWTDDLVLSKATQDGPDGDAFWSGFARMRQAPDPALIRRLKPTMMARVGTGDRVESNLIAFLLSGWGAKEPEQAVTDAELRDVLVLGDNNVRQSLLRFLKDWASRSQEWQELVLPFLYKVWPKQRTIKSPQMSSALLRFASGLPSQFAAILGSVSGRLVTLSHGHGLHLHCKVTDLDGDGVEALLSALEKLLPEDRAEWPYDGKVIIDELVAAGLGRGQRLDNLKRRAGEREY
ncbi:SIR2 family protein [Rhizobium leguminosarum]|uniref:SIR2 family protein n=1 Tax=Rhizobium leguminosarum TaxID=384 RepID=UPI003F963F38